MTRPLHNCAGSRKLRNRSAFTLIEILVVILILSILMAIGVPLFLAAVTDAQVKTCRANMQTIANAEAAWKTANSTHVYTTVVSNLKANFGETPVCPAGGIYVVVISNGTDTSNGKVVPSGGLIVTCDDLTHGTFAPGIDGH